MLKKGLRGAETLGPNTERGNPPGGPQPTTRSRASGLRPVLILSHDVFNDRSGTVIAMARISQEPRADFPLTLESNARGLPKRSWVKISQIRTLATERIGRRIGRASPEEVSKILEGLGEIIGDS